MDALIHFFSVFPPWLATVLMAMTPVGELRLSIPVAILAYKMPVWEAYVLSIIGNFIPPAVILLLAGRFHAWVQTQSGFVSRRWIKALARAQRKFEGKYEKYGLFGLAIFVGIPLPLTGGYTGALAAFVFGLSLRRSWPYMLAGLLGSGIVTTILSVGVDQIF